MKIKSITVSNFKSFDNMTIELGKLNILIGANASGKSNFIQILKFLKDLAQYGLDDAISLQGGVEYFRNVVIGNSKDFMLEVVFFPAIIKVNRKSGNKFIEMTSAGNTYRLCIKFDNNNKSYEVFEEKLSVNLEVFSRIGGEEGTFNDVIEISKSGNKITVVCSESPNSLFGELSKPLEKTIFPDLLIIEQNYYSIITPIRAIFSNISVYDFDSKLPKKPASIIARRELEENGENLALVVKNIIDNKDAKRKLFNLIGDTLPFLRGVRVEKYADKSLQLKLDETYSKDSMPAFLMSDGTVNIIALIVAIYFEEKTPVIVEEPESGIHPHLIAKVVEMMKDVDKQVIVTTHNPEMVKYADMNDILLVARDENGFSTISRPGTKEDLKVFLDNEIGLDELYVQNLL